MSNTNFDLRQSVLRTVEPMIGNTANETADSVLSKVDGKLAKLFEDRNALLTDGGTIGFTGTALSFTENLNISINSQVAGGTPTVISLGASTQSFGNLDMWYAVVDRTLGTATTVVVDSATGLPPMNSANQEVFLIAKRVDAADTTQRIYWYNGWAMSAGDSLRLYEGGSSGPAPAPPGGHTYTERMTYKIYGYYNSDDYENQLIIRLYSLPA